MKHFKGSLIILLATILCLVVVYATAEDIGVITEGDASLGVEVDNWDTTVSYEIDGKRVSVTASGYDTGNTAGLSYATIALKNSSNYKIRMSGIAYVTAVGAEESNAAEIALDYKDSSSNFEQLGQSRVYTFEVAKVLEPDESHSFVIYSPSGEGTSITFAFAPELSKIQPYSVTMGAAGAGGSYTATCGEQTYDSANPDVGKEFNISNDSTEGIALNATADTGYVFDGWYVGGKCVSADKSCTYIPSGSETDLTIAPRFLQWSAEKAPFSVNGTGTTCYTWETAMWLAGTGGTVVVADNYSLPTTLADNGLTEAGSYVTGSDGSLTYTIPAGVTLLVPYADARITETYMEQTPEESSGQDPWTINAESYEKAPYANRGRTDPRAQSDANVLSPVMDPLADGKVHRTLTIPATTTVRIEKGGVFSVGGVMSGGGHGTVAAAGGIIGQHSNIQLEGRIEVAGVFSCNGFVLGSGSITTESGGAIYEPFVVMDFHAGSWTAAAVTNANLAPIFLRYTMPNIQTDMTIVYGSHLYAYCDLIAGTQHNTTTGVIIGDRGDSAVIQLTAETSQVVMTYDAAKKAAYSPGRINGVDTAFASVGKSSLTITGGASYGALELKVTGNAPIKSSMFPLPLPYNVDVTLENGQYAIDKHFYILPGANLTVGGGATLTLGDIAVYDANQNNGMANIAVLDGLLEHTSHGNATADIKQGTIQAMAYPTPAELQASEFEPNGGLIVGAGGRLVLGNHVAFGGIIQANGTDAKVTAKTSAMLTCSVNIGLSTGSYRGRTEHIMTAQMVGDDALIDVVSAKSYTASGTGTCAKDSFTYNLYGSKDNAYTSTHCTTEYTSSITLRGGFTEASDSPYAATVIVSGTETPYEDFAAAWNKAVEADNATVRLEKVVTYGGTTPLTLGSGRTLTLDLNGYELVSTNADTTIENNGDLTVKGGVLSSTKTAGRNPIRLIHNTGTLLLSATLRITNTAATSGNYYCLYNDANAHLTLNGANIAANVSSSSSYALYNAANAAIDAIQFSTITSAGGDALYNLGTIAEGVLADGNVFTGCRYAVYTASAVNITGGTYKVTYTTKAGSEKEPGRAVLYCANKAGKTNIYGGTFTMDGKINYCAAVYNAGEIGSITGGTYTGGKGGDTVFFNAADRTIEKIENVSVTGVTAAVVRNYGTIHEIRGTDANKKPEFSSRSSDTILNEGTIQTIRNYKIDSNYEIAVKNNGGHTINSIESCEISSQTGTCVANQGKSTIEIIKDCKLEITGNSTNPALHNFSNNTIDTISGGTIIGQKYALQNKGTINKITGGCQFKATGSNDNGTNYKDTDLVAAVWNSGTISEIGGSCTFAANHTRAHGLFNNTSGKTPKVENCTFTAEGTYGNAFYNWGTFEKGVIQGCSFTANGTGGAAFCNRNQTDSAKIGTLKDCTFTATGAPADGNSSSALVNEAKGGTGAFQIDKIIDCKFIASGSGSKALMNQVTGSATGTTRINEISGCTFTAKGGTKTYSGTTITSDALVNQVTGSAKGTAQINEISGCTFNATGTDSNALVNQVTGSATGTALIDAIINCTASGQRCAVYNTCNSTGTGATAVINTISGGSYNSTFKTNTSNVGAVYNLAKGGTATIGTIQGCKVTAPANDGDAVRNYKAGNNLTAVAEIGGIIDCTLKAGRTALGNYVNSGSTGVGSKAVIGKIDGGIFEASKDNAITNQNGTIELISGGRFTTSASGMRALYSKNNKSEATGVGSTIGTISGGYFNAPNGAVYIDSGEIGAVTGGIFVAGSTDAFKIVTAKKVVFGGVFKRAGTAAPLDDNIIAENCQKVDIKNASIALPDGTTATGFYAVAPNDGCIITVDGSSVADVSLDGMGSGYTATDNVTVAAPEVKGYTFNGWCRSGSEKPWSTDLVVKTTVAQMLADGLFNENGTAKLVAKYEPVNDTYVTLKLDNAPDNTSVTGGNSFGDTGNVWRVPVGTQVTINVPNGTNFQYWANANDKVMSRGTKYTFTMVTNTTLTAVTNDSTSGTFVIFQSADERLLSVQSNLDSLKLPDAPYRVGYEFKGWKVDGAADDTVTKDADALKKAIEAAATATIVPVYSSVGGSDLKVTVYVNGNEDSSKTRNNLSLGDIATFEAPETSSDGKAFRFWASDAKGTNILSFSTTYSFRVTKGTTIYAIYGGENNPTAQPVVRVDDVLAGNESSVKSLTFMIGASIPPDYELVEMGALYAKGSATDEQLRVEKVDNSTVRKAVSRLNHETAPGLADFSYALGFKISGAQENREIYLRGYVAVKKVNDSTGTIYYYYSGVHSASYDKPGGTNS